MNTREAFESVMSIILENDRNFNNNCFVVKHNNLNSFWLGVFETAATVAADYLDEEHDLVVTVSSRDDEYFVTYRPFVWTPATVYGFTAKLFNYLFRKYDDALVKSCISLAEKECGMLYSEVKNADGVQRCHYGVKLLNDTTHQWEKVYEGTFVI